MKSCPNDAISLTVRPPTSELWSERRPPVEAAFLAMAIMGIVLVQNVTMLEVWDGALAGIRRWTGVRSEAVVFTGLFALAVAVPVALLAVVSRATARRNGATPLRNFALFGLALIPLDIGGHIAHNLFHLLAEGKAVVQTAMPLLGRPAPGGSPALVGPTTISVLQYAVLALGAAASVYAVLRIARSNYAGPQLRATVIPYTGLVAVLALANVVLFLFPMAHRM